MKLCFEDCLDPRTFFRNIVEDDSRLSPKKSWRFELSNYDVKYTDGLFLFHEDILTFFNELRTTLRKHKWIMLKLETSMRVRNWKNHIASQTGPINWKSVIRLDENSFKKQKLIHRMMITKKEIHRCGIKGDDGCLN